MADRRTMLLPNTILKNIPILFRKEFEKHFKHSFIIIIFYTPWAYPLTKNMIDHIIDNT